MNRGDLVKDLANRTDMTQTAVSAVLDAFSEALVDAAHKGEKVQLPGLFTMEVVERAARTGRNPQTGEEMKIPAQKAIKLSAGTTLKAAAKGGKNKKK